MKRIILTIFTLASLFVAKAEITEADYDFKVNVGYEDNPTWMYFKWVIKEEKTCKTALDPDIQMVENIANAEFELANASDTGGGGSYPITTCSYSNFYLQYISDPYKNVQVQAPYLSDNDPAMKKRALPEDGIYHFINEDGEEDYAILVEISDYTFAGRASGSIKIPDTVKRIGKAAFLWYSGSGATLDLNNVEEVGEYAFAHGYFGDIKFPQTKCDVYDWAFANMGEGITSMEFDYPYLHLGDYVFYNSPLTKLTITALGNELKDKEGNTVVQGSNIFEGSTRLFDVTIDNIDIPARMFLNCGKYNNIVIGDNVKNIGEAAFCLCYGKDLKFGESLEYIGKAAFMPCSSIDGPLTFPDSVVKIDDYAFYGCTAACPLTFSKSLEWVGDFAFFRNKYECDTYWTLHSKLKHVGINAFQFNRTATDENNKQGWKDLYVYAYAKTPEEAPKMPWADNPDYETNPNDPSKGFSGFGEYNKELEETDGWYNRYEYWAYAYVCLHVPVGCYYAYRNHEEWGKFQCIIADLVPEDSFTKDEDGSIQKHVGYVFLSLEPNVSSEDYKSYPLSENLFSDANFANSTKQLVDEWEIYDPDQDPKNNNVELLGPDYEGEDGKGWYVKPQHYGQQLILGYNNKESYEWDYGKNDWVPKRALVGAIMVFVCPTVTLVYDEQPVASKAPAKMIGALDDSTDTPSTPYDDVVSTSSSYQHRAIYNSYPKFGLSAPAGITIETIEKGHFNEDGAYTNGYGSLVNVGNDQLVGEGSSTDNDGGYIVPLNAITENRVIKLSSGTEAGYTTTGVETVKIDDTVSVTTNGLMLTINGADENAVVRVYDTKGILLKETTEKSILLPNAGVYVLTVEGVSFKAMVR